MIGPIEEAEQKSKARNRVERNQSLEKTQEKK